MVLEQLERRLLSLKGLHQDDAILDVVDLFKIDLPLRMITHKEQEFLRCALEFIFDLPKELEEILRTLQVDLRVWGLLLA